MARERYLVDGDGNRVAVILDMEQYADLLEQIDELDAIRAYDAAKSRDDEVVPFEQAVAEIREEPE